MRLTVSGWPGAGGTTLCLILAKNLNLQYLSVGEIFRKLGALENYSDTGMGRIQADLVNEEKFGAKVDEYISDILLSDSVDNIIIDSDITAFKLGRNKEFFSVFLIASYEARSMRLTTDDRVADVEFLKQRKIAIAEIYKKLWGINWLDRAEIKNKHNLMLDNSSINIEKEIQIICKELLAVDPHSSKKLLELESRAKEEEEIFWNHGKVKYMELLNKNKLIYDISDKILQQFS